jgi:RNA polymerase sigma factor (sigma-70 family)
MQLISRARWTSSLSFLSPQEGVREVRVTDELQTFTELVASLKSRMMRTIWRIVRHPEGAEDTFQEALTILWRKRQRIFTHPNPQALVLKICTNASIDTLRKHMRNREKMPLDNAVLAARDSGQGGSASMESARREQDILAAIGRLPRKQAVALLMRLLQDQPYSDIALVLGCSEVTARIHVSKARAKLSLWLEHLMPRGGREHEP